MSMGDEPAFPFVVDMQHMGKKECMQTVMPGFTKREVVSMKMMESLVRVVGIVAAHGTDKQPADWIAPWAMAYADALIAEWEKPK